MRVAIVLLCRGHDALVAALERAADCNEDYLSQHPETPRLYASGVRYGRETTDNGGHREERFLTIPWVRALGWGDCDDLTAYRLSELRWTGEDPDAQAEAIEVSPDHWHAVVRRGDGTIEDPSAKLGMNGSSSRMRR